MVCVLKVNALEDIFYRLKTEVLAIRGEVCVQGLWQFILFPNSTVPVFPSGMLQFRKNVSRQGFLILSYSAFRSRYVQICTQFHIAAL